MKLATDYKELAEAVKALVPDIRETIFAATEAHLAKKVTGKPGVLLCIALPPADSSSANEDNLSDRSRMLFFVIEQFDASQSEDKELTHWDKMGVITMNVRRAILQLQDERNPLLYELREQGMRTEPEYQLFGRFNGYSIGFETKDYDW